MTAQQLKNSILQMAVQGKLFPQNTKDESAKKLLERIRSEKQELIKAKKIKAEKNPSTIFKADDDLYYEQFVDGTLKCIQDDIPFDIPESWEWVRLREISIINPRNTEKDEIEAGFIPMNLLNEGYDNKHTFQLRKWKEIKSGFTHFRNGDIVIAKITPCFQNRKSAIISELPNEIGAGTTELHVVRFFSENLLALYFLYLFKTAYFIENGKKLFTGTAGQQRIGKDFVENFLTPLPPLAEQERIVEKINEVLPHIDDYDKAYTKIETLNKSFPEQLKKSILQWAVQGKLVPQDENDESASILLERIREEKQKLVKEGKIKKQSQESFIFRRDNSHYENVGGIEKCIDDEIPFMIPESWEWCRLEIVANIYTGNSINESVKNSKYMNIKEGLNYIGTKDVGFDSKINYKNGVKIPLIENKFKIARSGSTLLCIEGGSAGKKIAITNQDVCFGNKLCCFSPYLLDSKFMYYFLQNPVFFSVFKSNESGIIGGVSVNKVKVLLFPLPPLAEQERIVAKIEELLSKIEKL